MDGKHSEGGERFYKDADQLRAALVELYDTMRAELSSGGTEVQTYSDVKNATNWQLAREGVDLHEALARLDATGSAPASVLTQLERGDDVLTIMAHFPGIEGYELSADYEGEDHTTVLRVGDAIRRALSHHGRAETYQPLELAPPAKPQRWWDSQWFAALVGAVAAWLLSGVLPKPFG